MGKGQLTSQQAKQAKQSKAMAKISWRSGGTFDAPFNAINRRSVLQATATTTTTTTASTFMNLFMMYEEPDESAAAGAKLGQTARGLAH